MFDYRLAESRLFREILGKVEVRHWWRISLQFVLLALWYHRHRVWESPFRLQITVFVDEGRLEIKLIQRIDPAALRTPQSCKPWERLAVGYGERPDEDTLTAPHPERSQKTAGETCFPLCKLTEASHPFAPP